MQTISMPELAAGETYIATLFDAASQTGQHIILLDGDNNNATWEEQKSWATSIGGKPQHSPQPDHCLLALRRLSASPRMYRQRHNAHP